MKLGRANTMNTNVLKPVILALLCISPWSCTHSATPANHITISRCIWESLPQESDWLFLKCDLKNSADVPQTIALKPIPSSDNSTIREATSQDIASLQQRLKQRSLGVSPYLGGGTS